MIPDHSVRKDRIGLDRAALMALKLTVRMVNTSAASAAQINTCQLILIR